MPESSTKLTSQSAATETMTVRVRDHAAESHAWGSGYSGPIIRTVTIVKACPTCGGPRGEAKSHRFIEDGDWTTVDMWQNACGHVDAYRDVLREATA